MSARIASKFRRSLDLRDVGRFWLEYSRLGIERGLRAREDVPQANIHDVRLEDLMSSPLEVVEEIYRAFDLPFDDWVAAELSARIADEPTAQFGEHNYDIADYGLSETQILGVFADYRDRFEV